MAKVRKIVLAVVLLALVACSMAGIWRLYQNWLLWRGVHHAASGGCSAFKPFDSKAFDPKTHDCRAGWLEKQRDLILATAPAAPLSDTYVRVTGAGSEGDFAQVATVWKTPEGWRGQGIAVHMNYPFPRNASPSDVMSIERLVRTVDGPLSPQAARRIEQILATPCLYAEPAEVFRYSFKGMGGKPPIVLFLDGPDETLVEIVTPDHRRLAIQFTPIGLTGSLAMRVLGSVPEAPGPAPGMQVAH